MFHLGDEATFWGTGSAVDPAGRPALYYVAPNSEPGSCTVICTILLCGDKKPGGCSGACAAEHQPWSDRVPGTARYHLWRCRYVIRRYFGLLTYTLYTLCT